ncbi:hypothetical protein [Kineosporia babensis]|uniref:Uncharacterized protein n=1 Tax=Kineosporia babensis TaxID=499548 RepID=A0A9X1NBF3_9ACTN|nr:hypothetical protein [Kineosporia babensis]MCD5311033.1 hypothetical protein [Kineosporia babensis]
MAGYVAGWLVRKTGRAASAADARWDDLQDQAIQKVYEIVAIKLAGDPALKRIEAQAASSDIVAPQTQQHLQMAIEEAASTDDQFAARLGQVVAAVHGGAPWPQVDLRGAQGVQNIYGEGGTQTNHFS